MKRFSSKSSKISRLIAKTEDLLMDLREFLFRKGLLSNDSMVSTFICLLITIALIFTFITQMDNIFTYEAQAKNELGNNNTLKNEIALNTEKIAGGNLEGKDTYVERKLTELLSVEELTKLTRDYWNYELFINGNAVRSSDAPVSVSAGNADITITEKEKDRVLPVNIHAMGMVTAGDKSDNFYDHLLFDTSVKYSLTHEKKDNTTTAVYKIQGLKSGQKFVITLSEPLAKRLNFSSTSITITVK